MLPSQKQKKKSRARPPSRTAPTAAHRGHRPRMSCAQALQPVQNHVLLQRAMQKQHWKVGGHKKRCVPLADRSAAKVEAAEAEAAKAAKGRQARQQKKAVAVAKRKQRGRVRHLPRRPGRC